MRFVEAVTHDNSTTLTIPHVGSVLVEEEAARDRTGADEAALCIAGDQGPHPHCHRRYSE